MTQFIKKGFVQIVDKDGLWLVPHGKSFADFPFFHCKKANFKISITGHKGKCKEPFYVQKLEYSEPKSVENAWKDIIASSQATSDPYELLHKFVKMSSHCQTLQKSAQFREPLDDEEYSYSSKEPYRKDYYNFVADTDRYRSDRYEMHLSLRETDRGYSTGCHVWATQLGLVSFQSYWHYDKNEKKLADETFDKLQDVINEVVNYCTLRQPPMTAVVNRLRVYNKGIDIEHQEKSGVIGFNWYMADVKDESDWTSSLYGNRYPAPDIGVLKDLHWNVDEKSREIQKNGHERTITYKYINKTAQNKDINESFDNETSQGITPIDMSHQYPIAATWYEYAQTGKPIVIVGYHGTSSKNYAAILAGGLLPSTELHNNPEFGALAQSGYFFTPTRAAASRYAKASEGPWNDRKGSIIIADIFLKNPYVYQERDLRGMPYKEDLIADGHDGVVVLSTKDPQIVVFNRSSFQIRLVHQASIELDVQEDANEIAGQPISTGYVRLYRAETGNGGDGPIPEWLRNYPEYLSTKDASGRWFYSTKEEAEKFNVDFSGTGISYVDIPAAAVEKYRASNQPNIAKFTGGPDRAQEEFFLPPEIASRRKKLEQLNVVNRPLGELQRTAARLFNRNDKGEVTIPAIDWLGKYWPFSVSLLAALSIYASLGLSPEKLKEDVQNGKDIEQVLNKKQITPEIPQQPEAIQSEDNLPRGIRNNNPGNIVHGQKWQGMTETQNDDRFVTFSSPEYGIRAMARVLINYQKKHKLNTIREIINRWAPSIENDTNQYIEHFNKKGINPDKPINLSDDETMLSVIKVIIVHENGTNFQSHYSDDIIRTGIQMGKNSSVQHKTEKVAYQNMETIQFKDALNMLKEMIGKYGFDWGKVGSDLAKAGIPSDLMSELNRKFNVWAASRTANLHI